MSTTSGDVEPGQIGDPHRRREPGDVVVRRVDLEHEAGVGSDRVGVVAQVGPVGRADLADPRPGRLHELGQPESVADLDQLAPTDHDLLAGRQCHGGEQQRGGVVVDDVHAARGGNRHGQRGQRTATAAGAATGREVELDVCRPTGRHHRVDRGL